MTISRGDESAGVGNGPSRGNMGAAYNPNAGHWSNMSPYQRYTASGGSTQYEHPMASRGMMNASYNPGAGHWNNMSHAQRASASGVSYSPPMSGKGGPIAQLASQIRPPAAVQPPAVAQPPAAVQPPPATVNMRPMPAEYPPAPPGMYGPRVPPQYSKYYDWNTITGNPNAAISPTYSGINGPRDQSIKGNYGGGGLNWGVTGNAFHPRR